MKTEESREKIIDYFREQSDCQMPYCIQEAAANEGVHVVVVGGTHGNEPAGVRAMVEFHRRFTKGDIKLHAGKVSLLLGNPAAYRENRRYIDQDLNRKFIDVDDSTFESRRAREIKRYFVENKDICALLDLHSVSIGDFQICVYEKDNARSLDLALTISDIPLHFVFYPEHMPGTLIEEAGKHQICALIVECGNHLSKQGVNTALDYLCAILIYQNLMDASHLAEKTMPATIIRYESIQSIKPDVNFRFLIEDVKTGTKLEKGRQFALDDNGYHIAPQDCHVVVPSKVVKPTDIDAGFLAKKFLIETKKLK